MPTFQGTQAVQTSCAIQPTLSSSTLAHALQSLTALASAGEDPSGSGPPAVPVGTAAVSAPHQDPLASPAAVPQSSQPAGPAAASDARSGQSVPSDATGPEHAAAMEGLSWQPATAELGHRAGSQRLSTEPGLAAAGRTAAAEARSTSQPHHRAQQARSGMLSRAVRDACTQTDAGQKQGPESCSDGTQVRDPAHVTALGWRRCDEGLRWHGTSDAAHRPGGTGAEQLPAPTLPQPALSWPQPVHHAAEMQQTYIASKALATSGWDTADAKKLLSLLEQEHRTALVRRLLCDAASRHHPLHHQEQMPDHVAAH